jgi:hypothetical protein
VSRKRRLELKKAEKRAARERGDSDDDAFHADVTDPRFAVRGFRFVRSSFTGCDR